MLLGELPEIAAVGLESARSFDCVVVRFADDYFDQDDNDG